MGSVRRTGHRVPATLWGLAAVCSLFTFGVPLVAEAATVSRPASTTRAEPHLRGLNPSELSTRTACATPRPGYARCASEQLIYKASGDPVRTISTGSAGGASPTVTPAFTPAGYGPSELQSAYGLTSLAAAQGAGETIAVVDAYDDPKAASDLAVYRSHYGLPTCTTGCFTKINQTGGTTDPQPSPSNEDWSLEVSLDLDMASAICPKCDLLLVEANGPSIEDLTQAENTAAATAGVIAISNSYTMNESNQNHQSWNHAQAAAYNHPGVAITAASGDSGYEVNFPAVLSTVTAVGGTSLQSNGEIWSETAWSCEESKCEGTGGGCSQYVAKPSWQTDSGCANRTENDLSADANPNTGAAVYDTYNGNGGWEVVGGTSESSPIVAGFYALIGQGAGFGNAPWDYAHPGFFNDVTSGSNRIGCTTYLCEAIVGYDGPTGLGTPSGVQVPQVLTEQASEISATSATMHGTVNPNGGDTTYYFQYGATTSYGMSTTPNDAGSGTIAASVQPANLTGLSPSTTYHYRLVGVKGGRITTGQDLTFTTLSTQGSGSTSGGGSESGGSEGSSGGGSKEGGGAAEQPTGGSSSGSASGESSGTPSGPAGTSSSSSGNAANQPPRISALTLTANARTALRHGSLGVAQVAFSFRLSSAATVHATLAARVGSGAHRRWRALPVSLKFAATRGSNRRHLHSAGVLRPGIYRLTLTPAQGTARSILIRVR
jgi:hypothetical protein